MKEQFKKLIEVKSLVTLSLCGAFIVLTLRGKIMQDTFMIAFAMVLTYFFNKKADGDKKDGA